MLKIVNTELFTQLGLNSTKIFVFICFQACSFAKLANSVTNFELKQLKPVLKYNNVSCTCCISIVGLG